MAKGMGKAQGLPRSSQDAFNPAGAPTKAGFARGGQKLPKAGQPAPSGTPEKSGWAKGGQHLSKPNFDEQYSRLPGQMDVARGTGGTAHKPIRGMKGQAD